MAGYSYVAYGTLHAFRTKRDAIAYATKWVAATEGAERDRACTVLSGFASGQRHVDTDLPLECKPEKNYEGDSQMKLKSLLAVVKDVSFVVIDQDTGLHTDEIKWFYVKFDENGEPSDLDCEAQQLRTLLDKKVVAMYAKARSYDNDDVESVLYVEVETCAPAA